MEKLDKVIAALECCADLDRNCEGCAYDGAEYCEVALMKDALGLLKEYKQRFFERSCWNCRNADYVHEYEIYLCRREDGCRWEPKGEDT